MVARMKYVDRGDWRRHISNPSKRRTDPKKTASNINRWVGLYLKASMTAVQMLENRLKDTELPSCEAERLSSVLKRWKQIKRLCEGALHRIN